MYEDKYSHIKIAHLKTKSVIIVEIRDISSHIVEKNPKNTNFKIVVNSTKAENEFTTIKRKFVNMQIDRICADYSTGLNDCLKTSNYSLPSPEEIFTKLNGGKIFSKLDSSDAYLQRPLEEKCINLLTIMIFKGLYNFDRLPFGTTVAPGIFQ